MPVKPPKQPTPLMTVPETEMPGTQPPQRQGGWAKNLYRGLTDPRTQLFLLTMAYNLARPRGFGETPAGQILSGVIQGYQGLAASAELMRQRQLEQEKMALERRKVEAEARKAEAEAGRTEAMTPAEVESMESLAKRREAEAAFFEERARLLQDEVSAEKIKAEAARQDAETRAAELEQRANEARDLMQLRRDQLEELKRRNVATEELKRMELELRRMELEARKAYLEAQRAKIAAAIKRGDDPRKIFSDLVRAYLTAHSRMWTSTLEPIAGELPGAGPLADEAFEFAENVMSQLGMSPTPLPQRKPVEGLVITTQEVQQFAERHKIAPEEARKLFIARGYSIVDKRR